MFVEIKMKKTQHFDELGRISGKVRGKAWIIVKDRKTWAWTFFCGLAGSVWEIFVDTDEVRDGICENKE